MAGSTEDPAEEVFIVSQEQHLFVQFSSTKDRLLPPRHLADCSRCVSQHGSSRRGNVGNRAQISAAFLRRRFGFKIDFIKQHCGLLLRHRLMRTTWQFVISRAKMSLASSTFIFGAATASRAMVTAMVVVGRRQCEKHRAQFHTLCVCGSSWW
jgi:hypothetical protein